MMDQGSVDGLGLAEAIESLRDDLLKARAAGATREIQLPVVEQVFQTMTAVGERRTTQGPSR